MTESHRTHLDVWERQSALGKVLVLATYEIIVSLSSRIHAQNHGSLRLNSLDLAGYLDFYD